MSSEPKKVDVLILGAGLSGLSAAFRLQERCPEMTFLIAEANDRFGGRTLSVDVENPCNKDQTDTLDMGAHWVCERQKDIMQLIHKLDGIEYYPQNITGTKIMQVGYKNKIRTYQSEIPNMGTIRGLIDSQLLINYIESLASQVDIRDPYLSPTAQILDSKTLEDLVKDISDVPEVFEVFNAACLSCFGCDMTQISALFAMAYANAAGGMMKLLMVEDAAQEYRIKGGSQNICKKLLEEIGYDKLLLNHKAVQILQHSGEDLSHSIEVRFQENPKSETSTSIIWAKKVISTIPPNIIMKNITFKPELKYAKRRLYENLIMANLTKIYVLFKTSFWLEEGFSGEVVSNGGPSLVESCEKGPVVIFFDATTRIGTPALVGFIGGKAADQWNSKSTLEIQKAVLNQLESYFGNQVQNAFVQFLIKDWTTEPDVGGGPVNYMAPGQMHNFHELRTPHQNVHFAGTATSVEWCGYMSGAVQSGYRAAAEILQDLQSTALKAEDLSLIEKTHPPATSCSSSAISGTERKIRLASHYWKPKYQQARFFFGSKTTVKILVGMALGILVMHPRFKIADNMVRIWHTFHYVGN